MPAGRKPRFSITARRKDAPRGSKERTNVGAAWDGRFPGAYNASFGDVIEMVMKDGSVIKTADFFFDLKDWTLDDRATRGTTSAAAPTSEPASEWGSGAGVNPGDDVPF